MHSPTALNSPTSAPASYRVFRFLRIKAILEARGVSRSKHYLDTSRGLYPSMVKISEKASALPDFEVEAMQRATVAGASEHNLRALVKRLEAARTILA
jgi:prophage regulatory protein